MSDVHAATQHLFDIVEAVENHKSLPPIYQSQAFLEDRFPKGDSLNMKLLNATIWAVDGIVLNLPNLRARVARLEEFLSSLNPHTSDKNGTEILTASHSQLYYAAFGMIQWMHAKYDLSGLVYSLGTKWLQEDLFLCTWCRLPDNSGVWAPGARAWLRGKKLDSKGNSIPPLASNSARDLAYRVMIQTASHSTKIHGLRDKYNIGARCLNAISSRGKGTIVQNLVQPKMPAPFHVRRENNGTFAAWFDNLVCLRPCQAAGYDSHGLWTSENAPLDLNETNRDGIKWSNSVQRLDIV